MLNRHSRRGDGAAYQKKVWAEAVRKSSQEQKGRSIARLCKQAGHSRQAYYDHFKRAILKQNSEAKILEMVLMIRHKHPRTGVRKIYFMIKSELKKHGIKLGRDGMFELMRNNGLLVKKKKKYRMTTNSNHRFYKYPNLIKDMTIDHANVLWVSDITYLQTIEGFVYLSLVSDAYSRMIIGYNLSTKLDSRSCCSALEMAIKANPSTVGLIHHSDRGIQYCSKEYTSILLNHRVNISMTSGGSPQENAIAERINGVLKQEYLISDPNQSIKEARKSVEESIRLYNLERPHLSCNMMTPYQMHHKVTLS